jgi:hypothetical protein
MSVPPDMLGMLLQGAGPQPTMPGIMLPQGPATPGFGGPTVQPQVSAPAPMAAPAPQQNDGILGKIQGLMADPNFRMALLQTGTGMMRSPRMGENGWDVAGEAIMRGAMTLQGLRERDRQQKMQDNDRAFDREVKTASMENDRQRTKVYEKTADAQIKSAQTQEELARLELDPEYQRLKRLLVEAGIDEKKASANAAKALTRERDAQADLHKRTDPNLRSGGGPDSGGFDVRAAEARVTELMRTNPMMTKEEARATAYNEQTEAKRRTTDVNAMTQAIEERAKAIAFGLVPATPEEKANPYEAAKAQIIAQRQDMLGAQQPAASPAATKAQADTLAKQAQGRAFIGADGSSVRVLGAAPDGRIRVISTGKDGVTRQGFITVQQLEAEMGAQ